MNLLDFIIMAIITMSGVFLAMIAMEKKHPLDQFMCGFVGFLLILGGIAGMLQSF